MHLPLTSPMFQFTLVASPCAVTEISQINNNNNNNKKTSNSNNNDTDCYNNCEYILMNSFSNIHQTIDYFCGVVCEKWRNAPMYGACKNDDL